MSRSRRSDRRRFLLVAACLPWLVRAGIARADEPARIAVTLKDHRFSPSEIHVAAGKPAVIEIDNRDSTAEEFDSAALQIEKVIAGGRKGIVRLQPLAKGRYPFMGEYHADTAQGVVIAE